MNPRFDLLTLQLLHQVGQMGSVARAADALHLTPSAGSKRILELESQLGVTLLARSPGGASLTAAGIITVARAEAAFNALHGLTEELRPFVSGHAGEVRVASNTSGLCACLADHLADFSASAPGIRISVLEATSAAVAEAVLNGSADIGVANHSMEVAGLGKYPYARTPLVLAVPRGHALADRPDVTYAEALTYPQISRAPGSALARFSTSSATEANRSSPGVTTLVTSFPAVFALVAAGLGVAVIPLAPVAAQAPRNIVLVPLADDWANFELSLLIDPASVPAPAVSLLIAFLRRANQST